jgi:hypothetical protein
LAQPGSDSHEAQPPSEHHDQADRSGSDGHRDDGSRDRTWRGHDGDRDRDRHRDGGRQHDDGLRQSDVLAALALSRGGFGGFGTRSVLLGDGFGVSPVFLGDGFGTRTVLLGGGLGGRTVLVGDGLGTRSVILGDGFGDGFSRHVRVVDRGFGVDGFGTLGGFHDFGDRGGFHDFGDRGGFRHWDWG